VDIATATSYGPPYDGYAIATLAVCSSYRPALCKRDNGRVHTVQALAKDRILALCKCQSFSQSPDPFHISADYMKKYRIHMERHCYVQLYELGYFQLYGKGKLEK
jgi:hypothetical protein